MNNKCFVEEVVDLYFKGYGVEDALKIAKGRNELRECLHEGIDYVMSMRLETGYTTCKEPKLLAMCKHLNGLEDIGGLKHGESRKKETE